MQRASLQRLNAARRKRIAAILLADLDSHTERIVLEGDPLDGPIADLIEDAFRSGRSMAFDAAEGRGFLNVYLPAPRIAIIGAVHIGQYLTQLAGLAGFDVRIIDPRTAFATSERFPGVPLSTDWPADAFLLDPLDRYTALVALTHDPTIDDLALAEALRTGCFYIGALGSRKTHAARTDRLALEGFTPDALSAIHAPIGLDIGASNPAEIAVAILGEVIQALRSRPLSLSGDGAR
ncbi:XdhC/CoxF family protein [Rhizobium anhuiense]|jgi:xanthine dehydrogenase accessory factor|uniref:XdhC/CoxF family protein n=1 Tax=Rhizobium anhuiense TaxID=1184720 RepID=A0ABX4J2Y7_9HYPH|nr:XdhC family protein [Rhizobium anhuiense]PDS41433.1 XdhC/CoxF family protein [Rhizobium anhuiense]PDS49553.1 XdhC/CoxF family protein [Rhizobium anhuiense]PDS55481.1 XdhC/CoxF family protein [Rhizobium anhuiense]UTS88335.1 XdhC family protein [Rhizobium anhuiense bv. trifolii]